MTRFASHQPLISNVLTNTERLAHMKHLAIVIAVIITGVFASGCCSTRHSVSRWEYKVEKLASKGPPNESSSTFHWYDHLQEVIQSNADQGWGLAEIVPLKQVVGVAVVFKRKK